MVDFNNDSTISKPPIEIVNLIVIEHWYNYRLADEFYMKLKLQKATPSLAECKSRLRSLFLSTLSILKRKMAPEDYDKLFNDCCSIELPTTIDPLMQAYIKIHTILDDAGLIKLDTKPYVNRQRIEQSNKAAGY